MCDQNLELKRAIIREKQRECKEHPCQAVAIYKFPSCPFCPYFDVCDEYGQCEG